MNEINHNQKNISIIDSYYFLKECEHFFLATVVDNKPRLRPMGWLIANEKALFLATDKRKNVYTEMKNNPNIEIAGYNLNTRKWVRVTGYVEHESSQTIQEDMMIAYPMIRQIYTDQNAMYLSIFKLNVEKVKID